MIRFDKNVQMKGVEVGVSSDVWSIPSCGWHIIVWGLLKHAASRETAVRRVVTGRPGQASGLFQKLQETREACHILEGVDRNAKTRQSTILQSSENLEAKQEPAQKAILILDELKK